jgi:hypothetical protein
MVLAEKIVTVLQRGQASTRWRDFGDIYLLTRRYFFHANELRQALQVVADYRHVEISSLDDALDGYAEIGQEKWGTWRRRLELADSLPASFGDALDVLELFADPILTGSVDDSASWDPAQQAWSDGS